MAADEGSKVYGRLSVMLQARCRVEYLFKVPPGAFRPPPKVDSAIVRLVPLAATEVAYGDHAVLERVVRHAFSQRRKTLRNALKAIVGVEAIIAAGVDPTLRPEMLTPAQFAAIAVHVPEA
jgi:16S rRNA (adenine1518-N6/adenine1519-N6)-dimethyltransferase